MLKWTIYRYIHSCPAWWIKLRVCSNLHNHRYGQSEQKPGWCYLPFWWSLWWLIARSGSCVYKTIFSVPHSPDYNVEFFRNFQLVMNALDNRGNTDLLHFSTVCVNTHRFVISQNLIVIRSSCPAARNHVNRMCLAADIPLIESGTAGYLGQVTVIKKVRRWFDTCTFLSWTFSHCWR